MKAKTFEQQFDDGLDVTPALDLSGAKRVLQEQKRVNVDFPTWMIDSLDREASKLGVTRQSVIKIWLAERLEAARPVVPLHANGRARPSADVTTPASATPQNPVPVWATRQPAAPAAHPGAAGWRRGSRRRG